jgi:hypothetical protein
MGNKKETLEEAAERFYTTEDTKRDCNFIEGAKWQQEQDQKMYSEEDMIAFGNKMQIVSDVDFDGNIKFAFTPSEYFEQFKNNKNGK